MYTKIKDFFKAFDEKVLNEKADNTKFHSDSSMNFKGQRNTQKRGAAPYPTQEQFEQGYRLDPEIRMQSRKLRLKNWGYLGLFSAWYAGVILFIMYRLRGDDLETMEKEANQRIRISKQIKENQK